MADKKLAETDNTRGYLPPTTILFHQLILTTCTMHAGLPLHVTPSLLHLVFHYALGA